MLRRHVQWLVLILGVCSALIDESWNGENEDNSTSDTIESSKGSAQQQRQQQQRKEQEEKRLWGAASSENVAHGEASSEQQHANSTPIIGGSKDKDANSHPSALPFVGKASSSIPHQYGPPKGFEITSRVYTDPDDKLAHFDNDGSIVFPYWECGVSGSSTVPIPLQHATVRHLLGGSKPNLYSGEEFGPHPQLVIALTSLEVLLNSGQIQTFSPGDVLLLEDVLSGGHKLKGSGQSDMTVMILTLPDHYHQVGKDNTSLKSILAKADKQAKNNPCPGQLQRIDPDNYESTSTVVDKVAQALQKLQPRSIRRYVLGVIGLSISTLMGDFMGKVAPLWLAVVFGGGCFVTGGTYCFVKVGDYCLDEIETWQERRQLQGRVEMNFNDNDGKRDVDVDDVEELLKPLEPLESHKIQ